jgi:hypothetical protein
VAWMGKISALNNPILRIKYIFVKCPGFFSEECSG